MAAPEPNTDSKTSILNKLKIKLPAQTKPQVIDTNPKLTAWNRYKVKLESCGFIYSDTVAIAQAAYVSRHWIGEPLWILVLGPPSAGKTLPLTLATDVVTLEEGISQVKLVSSLTPAFLCTAFGGHESDRSLFAKINGHLLIVKDYGTIMSLGWEAMTNVLALLREAFDGQVSRGFANIERSYTLHFNMVCAATDAADTHAGTCQQLGERFIRYRPEPIKIPYPAPPDVTTLGKEYTKEFLEYVEVPETMPMIPDDRLFQAACVAAKLRTQTLRDHRHHEVEAVPQFESPYRMVHQLEKMWGGTLVLTGDEVLANKMALRLALDSIPPRRRALFNLLRENPGINTVEITKRLTLGPTIVRNCCDDLHALGLIKREIPGFPKQYEYTVEETLAKDIEDAFGVL